MGATLFGAMYAQPQIALRRAGVSPTFCAVNSARARVMASRVRRACSVVAPVSLTVNQAMATAAVAETTAERTVAWSVIHAHAQPIDAMKNPPRSLAPRASAAGFVT